MTADVDMLISAFGNAKDSMLAGIDWHIMGTYDGKNLIAQVSGTGASSEWTVKGMRGSAALRFIQAIIEQTQTDLEQSHVPTDSATGLDSFRVDNDLNIRMMRQVGAVKGSYNTMRYTFGPPKAERDSGHLVEWRLIGLHQGSWVPVVIRQPMVQNIEDTELVTEWQVGSNCCCCCCCCCCCSPHCADRLLFKVLGMSASASDWAQNLLRSQHAHMNWEAGGIATSFLSGIQSAAVDDGTVDEC